MSDTARTIATLSCRETPQHGVRLRHCAAVALALLGAALLAGCSNESALPPQSETTPHNVTLTKEQQQSIHIVTLAPTAYRTTITTTGVVHFDHDRAAEVLAPFSGAVTRVLVSLGATVTQGQPLAEVSSPEYAAAAGAYRKAVLAASAADSVAANDRALFARQAISERDNADARTAAAGADAERAAALQALVALHMDRAAIAAIGAGRDPAHGAGVIRAPINGTVVAKSIAPGQTLAAGTSPCFTVADTSRMWVMAHLFGREIVEVQPGDSATVDAGDGGPPVRGTVTNVGAVIDPDTRAVDARISVDNPHGALKKLMYVTAHLQSRQQRTGLLVPVAAVLRNGQDLPFVYTVASGGGYARTAVTLGPRVGDRVVIPSGLHAGDRVVVDGNIFLHFIQTQ